MRQVYDNDMVAHLWANQSQTSARNATRNFYFEGNTIFSYGGHFPIAKIIDNKRGRAVLFTTRTYSVTTAKHVRLASGASRHLLTFNVDDLTGPVYHQHIDNLKSYEKRIVETIDKARRARKNGGWLFGCASSLAKEANKYMKFFGIRRKPFADLSTEEERNKAIERCKRAEALERAQRSAAQKRREQLQAKREIVENEFKNLAPMFLDQWRASGTLPKFSYEGIDHSYNIREVISALGMIGYDLLRVESETVHTSRGADVPLSHVERAYRQLAPIRAAGETWNRNGHTIHVGAFQIDSLEESGDVRAGCHVFAWSEVERFAKSQGW